MYNKTCKILSYHYDNPKTREKNADLLCKRLSLRDFDHPPFLLWFGCVLNWFMCVICAAYKPVWPMWIKLRFFKKLVDAAYNIQVHSIDRKLRYFSGSSCLSLFLSKSSCVWNGIFA